MTDRKPTREACYVDAGTGEEVAAIILGLQRYGWTLVAVRGSKPFVVEMQRSGFIELGRSGNLKLEAT